MTSMRRSSRRSGWMLRSRTRCTRTLQATVQPQPRGKHGQQHARESAHGSARCQNEGKQRGGHRDRTAAATSAAARGKGKRSRRSNKARKACESKVSSWQEGKAVRTREANGPHWDTSRAREGGSSIARKRDNGGLQRQVDEGRPARELRQRGSECHMLRHQASKRRCDSPL